MQEDDQPDEWVLEHFSIRMAGDVWIGPADQSGDRPVQIRYRSFMFDIYKRYGPTIAGHAGDRSPGRTQRLLDRVSWDTLAAMSEVRRFGAAGLARAVRRGRPQGGLVIATTGETGQEKAGGAIARGSTASIWDVRTG